MEGKQVSNNFSTLESPTLKCFNYVYINEIVPVSLYFTVQGERHSHTTTSFDTSGLVKPRWRNYTQSRDFKMRGNEKVLATFSDCSIR